MVLLFLILVNVVFFAWSRWVDVAPGGVAVVTPEPQAEALVLYSEKFPADAQTSTEPDVVAVVDEAIVTTTTAPEPEAIKATPVVDAQPVAQRPSVAPAPEPDAAVAASQETAARDAVQAATTPPAETPTLALLNDRGPPTTRCMTIGPFRELKVAGAVASTLRSTGLEPEAREEEASVWVGHWVHLPPAGSRAAAVEVVEKLRTDGVSDIYIESSGAMRHAISLGLFSDVSRAETRAGKIRQLGVRPQIRDRYRDGTQHWVDIELAPGQQLDATRFADLPDDNASLTERPCDSAADSAA